MTDAIPTVNSTRPITFASAVLRGAVALALAGLALATIAHTVRAAWATHAASKGAQILAASAALPRGLERDTLFAEAQAALEQGLRVAPDDPRLWNLLAQTRQLQATEATASATSPVLAAASASAAARAAALAPRDPEGFARLALARSIEANGAGAAAIALARSYAYSGDGGDGREAGLANVRLEAAGRAWRLLEGDLRAAVEREACGYARTGPGAREWLRALRMGSADPGLALKIDALLSDPACAPPGPQS